MTHNIYVRSFHNHVILQIAPLAGLPLYRRQLLYNWLGENVLLAALFSTICTTNGSILRQVYTCVVYMIDRSAYVGVSIETRVTGFVRKFLLTVWHSLAMQESVEYL